MKKDNMFHSALSELHPGVNLIEASAGTGKTFAIAMLVLRFVVEEKIPLENILIVTFTNAATKELRGRIRKRLVQARDILESPVDGKHAGFDQPLQDWSATFTDQHKRHGAVLLLEQALYSIDQAPVFTIHGFCQRMLGEQALESRQAFDCELLTDLGPLMEEIAQDYWRSHFYHESTGVEEVLLSDKRFASPQALLGSVNTIRVGNDFIPQDTAGKGILACRKDILQHFNKIRRWWSDHGQTFQEKILEAEENDYLKKSFAQEWKKWIDSLDQWCCSQEASPFFMNSQWLVDEEFANHLNGSKLRGQKKQSFLDGFPFYSEARNFVDGLEKLVLFHRIEFSHFLQEQMDLRLTRQGCMGFDDLICNLADVLEKEPDGQLQTILARRFKAALIDEFQDTDNKQYRIFSKLFGTGRHFLYLIGDPKQAIYSFRGADIHSYFVARKAAEKRLTLDTNYRTHPLLIAEINRLFSGRENPFFYSEEVLPFSPVHARKPEECEELKGPDGTSANGLVYWLLPPNESKNQRWSAGNARSWILQHTIAEIGRILSQGYVIHENNEKRTLAPRDIAVLVRKNDTAQNYANALADMGIPAVVTSRASVFSSRECEELLLLLAAILNPNHLPRAKAALALSWFGHDGADIYEMGRDESCMGNWQLRLMEYGRQWYHEGFFSMMGTLLEKEKVLGRLARGMRGERCIANLRQLLVLVEEVSVERNLLPREVYQWLLKQNNTPGSMTESELLLESDREAVQIVTMHSAKGLEYGVVFCVDLWGGRDGLASEENQILYRSRDGLGIDLGSKDFSLHKQEAKQELQAEDLRLLYVAVTRAKMRCYTVWADVSGRKGSTIDSFASSLGYLLFPEQDAAKCNFFCQQEKIADRTREKGVDMQVLEEQACLSFVPNSALEQNLQRRLLSRNTLGTAWRLSSFSSLAGLSEYEYEIDHDSDVNKEEGPEIAVMGLPAGAHFGSAVHDILENNSFSRLASDHGHCLKCCTESAAVYGVSVDAQKLAQLIGQSVHAALTNTENGDTFSLAKIPDHDCLKEMPFYLLHNKLKTNDIFRLLADDPTVVSLGEKEIEGYVTGFIDLICRWQGRYYIMDYKTNHLGNYLSDYQQDGLVAAMRSHNYGLQYWLYTVALHRYLGRMEKDYDYHRHFGGVFYLFVRGMATACPGSGVFFTLPCAHKVEALDMLLGGKP